MEGINSEILGQNLEVFGTEYVKEHLKIWQDKDLESNWWQALDFFLSHSFMRGRRDELSNEYYSFTIDVLSDFFSISDNNLTKSLEQLIDARNNNLFYTGEIHNLRKEIRNSFKHEKIINIKKDNPLIDKLTIIRKYSDPHKKDTCLQNDLDLLMVLDTLDFIASSNEKANIYNYFRSLITGNQMSMGYKELCELDGIGDKIATFFLRDIILLNNYEIEKDQIRFVFAVDTWVAQITSLLANKELQAEDPTKIRDFYSQNFPMVNFPLVAAGLWYLGSNSLKIAINFIKENRIDSGIL